MSLRKTPEAVASLVFLHFNQLLRLGEQTGRSDSTSYLAVKDGRRKRKPVGARSSSVRDESTLEIFLSIP